MSETTRPAQRPFLPVLTRSCGSCSLCCTVMAVPDIGKERNERCSHLRSGRCGIYADRPNDCRSFRCLWLQGVLPAELRPDKVRAVGDVNGTGELIVFHVAPDDRGAHRRGALGQWIRRVTTQGKDSASIIVVCGDERHALGPIAEKIMDGTVSLHDAVEYVKEKQRQVTPIVHQSSDEGTP